MSTGTAFRFPRTLWMFSTACVFSIACSSDAKTPSDPGGSSGPAFSAPIPIAIGQPIGAATYTAGDSTVGGQGQTVQGVACDASIPTQHIHAHLTIIANGVQRAIPLAVGVPGAEVISNFVVDGRCFYWLHTHDATGIVHVEAPVSTAFTLGEFFAVWGEPLTRTNVGGFEGAVVAYVDSTRYDGDLSSLAFKERQQITLIIGTIPDTIPVYEIPSAF
jgi:hypothetical protein